MTEAAWRRFPLDETAKSTPVRPSVSSRPSWPDSIYDGRLPRTTTTAGTKVEPIASLFHNFIHRASPTAALRGNYVGISTALAVVMLIVGVVLFVVSVVVQLAEWMLAAAIFMFFGAIKPVKDRQPY